MAVRDTPSRTGRTQPFLTHRPFPGEKVLEQPVHMQTFLSLPSALPVGTFPAAETPVLCLGVTRGHGEGFMWSIRP